MMNQLKILCVLFDDPSNGMPHSYPRARLPEIKVYPDGQPLPKASTLDFKPGSLLGCISGELGLRQFLEQRGHQLVVTSDKDGEDSEFERELKEADVVICQPFWPAYLDESRISRAKKLKLVITAGIGSDHVDLDAAMRQGITVSEVTWCNSISVAEHSVMMILALVRDFMRQHQFVRQGGWHIADCVQRSYDLEGMQVGIVAAGRIGLAVLKRLKPFDVGLHYHDRKRLPRVIEEELNLKFHPQLDTLLEVSDVLSLHCPLHAETAHMINKESILKMKKGAYLVNTARGGLCETHAVKEALESGYLAGYAGDVWYPQPPAADHPWRTMPNHAMTPHTSGASLSAQSRYAQGTREILECWLDGKAIREEYLIVDQGRLAGTGAKSYSEGKLSLCD